MRYSTGIYIYPLVRPLSLAPLSFSIGAIRGGMFSALFPCGVSLVQFHTHWIKKKQKRK